MDIIFVVAKSNTKNKTLGKSHARRKVEREREESGRLQILHKHATKADQGREKRASQVFKLDI